MAGSGSEMHLVEPELDRSSCFCTSGSGFGQPFPYCFCSHSLTWSKTMSARMSKASREA